MEDGFFINFMKESLSFIEQSVPSKDVHDRIKNDFEAPTGFFSHINNHNGEFPSIEYWMRETFIEILYNDMRGYDNISSFLNKEKKGGEYIHLKTGLEMLNTDERDELSELLKKFNINIKLDLRFCPDTRFFSTPESRAKWEIEKAYLCYWLDKAKTEDLSPKNNLNQSFNNWKTDGQRIARCYQKHWILLK